MSFTEKYSKTFKYLLPSPFTIAVVLTFIVFFTALFTTNKENQSFASYSVTVAKYWEDGVWNNSSLVFTLQMMLMLVLGHVLALSKPINSFILKLVKYCTNTANAAGIVTLLTVLVSLFNWGLGLIFGAIFARKVAEHAQENNISLNYSIIGAAGYSGLMVWHGGLSGSSLSKVAENNHLKDMMTGLLSPEKLELLPTRISYWETLGSSMNITVMILSIIILPIFMYFVGKHVKNEPIQLQKSNVSESNLEPISGAEKLDYSRYFSLFFGLCIMAYLWIKIARENQFNLLDFFTPDNINMLLLCLAILLHSNFTKFLSAVDDAMGGAAGILIQFPLYFGIMGIMKGSGLVADISNLFISISTENSFPLYTFFSASIINIFVPSGGGQWAVQGPIVIQSALELGSSLPKNVLALAYGDQLTNMLQPFWALPLLGITGLKAKQIIPYSVLLMLVGFLILTTCLILF
ncbi:MAG: short-chain fatty acid transporter [Flavobacteriales bacterium]|nr:short-chain fatty acid transporter [Flavobacteriales bacterium]